MMRLRKIWAEGSFSVLKREHCLSKIPKRGILAANEECLLSTMALNLKRMVKCLFCLNIFAVFLKYTLLIELSSTFSTGPIIFAKINQNRNGLYPFG